jgi:2-polyprenyl-6-methoxyphenol hydroxylase-like FAD-dependent oxidoreductase
MRKRAVSIVGGGVGGLTLARFLAADGHKVTVLERAKDFSAQGHTIGMRGIGLQAMDLLGLGRRVAQAGLNPRASASYSMKGQHLRTTSYADHGAAVGGIVVTQRGLLHAALHENLPKAIDLRFDVQPMALKQDAASVTLRLSDASSLSSDIVVGADGANSAMRGLVLPNAMVLDRGVYVGATVDIDHGLPPGEVATFFGKARTVIFFTYSATRTAIVIYQDNAYPAPSIDADAATWATYLNTDFQNWATPVRRTLGAIKPGDRLFKDRIRQVPPSQTAIGRAALLGDAGYCASFFSGNGAGLAAAGAFCLAKSLGRDDDDLAALQSYEARIVPFVAPYHANADRLRGTLFMRSDLKLLIRRLTMRYMSPAAVARMARRHYRGEIQLSDLG